MPRTLITDWKRVATSGKTADGRTIDPQDLRDMAASYNPATYTATIWYEHIRYFGSMGTVAQVKAEELDGGHVALFARLQPNDRLLQLNKDGQKIFSSVEIQPNFGDSGQAYLCGLAVTDEPASLGTEPLHFSRKAATGNHFANVEPLGDLMPAGTGDAGDTELKFFARLMNLFQANPLAPPFEENSSMDPKTAEVFAAAVAKLDTVAIRLETSAATFAAQPAAPIAPAVPVAETITAPGVGVTAEQFSELQGSLQSLTHLFNTALNQGQGQHVPLVTGAVDEKPEAVY
ncbi:GPO family capsid scaffolding protein [Pseudomonas sp. CCI4.2]|uniref:GPO family capsid scaffolding protein n=1 Tax=Pseudomonas sp. CCI4.2 TaxID=3048620 RepID=UPI002AC8A79D|nr:GPO family capsid scaffolding protein [Pseudomonas sp. CCI4.2]MEB0090059.1 GPO family capsid scaffolding protein [Pseudomonas sp. CCI4.2]WPX53477.1 GPO family capsid scaffolding protein [Pseudomonas sp. CCI4.2]